MVDAVVGHTWRHQAHGRPGLALPCVDVTGAFSVSRDLADLVPFLRLAANAPGWCE
jgi:hypothetical protein